MCGFGGGVSLSKDVLSLDIKSPLKMSRAISHRGPDDSGYLFFHTGCKHNKNVSFYLELTDEEFKDKNPYIPSVQNLDVQNDLLFHDWDLFFVHRRLSIIDLSFRAHQPYCDLTKNIWIAYNGEIYNFRELREELIQRGHRFRSYSDTEVIVYSYIEWGIEAISKFNGMFSIAIYDNFKKKLYLIRDRYGIKPLYYTYINSKKALLFSSEVKGILAYKDFKVDLDKEALVEYLTFQNFFSDRTLYKNIRILPAGSIMEIDIEANKSRIFRYWDFDFFRGETFLEEKEYVSVLQELFYKAVKRELISDVEVGSFLSGGLDSGAISSIASQIIPDLKTFTIGFDLSSVSGLELNFDERKKAEYMSYHFRTEHYEMVLKSGDMEKCLPEYSYFLEEPRVGQSYPNFYAYKLASKFVKVSLSGTGGDELFGGYPWRYLIPKDSISYNQYIDSYYSYWERLTAEKERYSLLQPIWQEVKEISTREIFKSIFADLPSPKTRTDYIKHAFYLEAKTFLHGLLIIEDKLSMAHSLETRVPFLDNELVDFALSVPVELKVKFEEEKDRIDENLLLGKRNKVKNTNGKVILRKALKKYLPEEILNLPKQGFSAPDASWFRGESIDYVKRVLFNKETMLYNFLDRQSVKKLVEEHLSGKKNRRLLVWSLINLEWWLRNYIGEKSE